MIHDWSAPSPQPFGAYEVHDGKGRLIASWVGDASPGDRQEAIDEVATILRIIGAPDPGTLAAEEHPGEAPSRLCAITPEAFESGLRRQAKMTCTEAYAREVLQALTALSAGLCRPPAGGRIVLLAQAIDTRDGPTRAQVPDRRLPKAVATSRYALYPRVSHNPHDSGVSHPLAMSRPLRRALAALSCSYDAGGRFLREAAELPGSASARAAHAGLAKGHLAPHAETVAQFLRERGMAEDADALETLARETLR